MHLTDQDYLLAINAALEAGKAVMEIYATDFDTELKEDGSPITLADKKANDIIGAALAQTGIIIISEESTKAEFSLRRDHDYIWLVDPIDGTKEFTQRNGEFTINIALIYRNEPIFGIVTAPALNLAWLGWKDRGAFKSGKLNSVGSQLRAQQTSDILKHFVSIKTKANPAKPCLMVSRSHLTENTMQMIKRLLGDESGYTLIRKGSSLKFCMLADGLAHYYLRADEINEWDTAAGVAVLLAAGGDVITWPRPGAMQYNTKRLLNPGFVAFADIRQSDLLLSEFPL